MQRKEKRAVVTVLLAACLAASLFFNAYYIADGGYGGTLYWKGDQAYLFSANFHQGYRVSYFALPFEFLAPYVLSLWAPRPSDRWSCALVIRITPSSVERYTGACGPANGNDAYFVTPFDDGFYALCQGAILCKWTVSGYVPAMPEEKERLDGGNRLVLAPQNNQVMNGWRVHYPPENGGHFEIHLTDGSVISVTNRATDVRAHSWVAVELLRPGQKPQTLCDEDGTPRRVSKKEYKNTFPSPKSRLVG